MNYIYSWNPHSAGAKKLAKALGWKRIRHEGSRFRGRADKLVVNWGSSEAPASVLRCTLVNMPGCVVLATNKLLTYTKLQQHEECQYLLPFFTQHKETAEKWRKENERSMLCRLVINGHGGQGIRYVRHDEPMVDAPLYVEYVAKKEEYRVHVLGPEKLSVQQKKRRLETPDAEVDWHIRNYRNGFIFARADVQPPELVVRAARDAVYHLGLHFGAVDIGWNDKHRRVTVYEVNTAPGLEGTTLSDYVDFFKRVANGEVGKVVEPKETEQERQMREWNL
jgi:glutathione synthase/RimK-type ligase-like ATP-grasp enzyme